MTTKPGDELQSLRGHTSWLWMAVFFVVAIFGFGATPWAAIKDLLRNQGVSDEGKTLIAFTAGYTLPLTAGIGVCVLLCMRGVFSNWRPLSIMAAIAAILAGAGSVAKDMGLGLLPDYAIRVPQGGHPAVRAFVWVLGAYFNSYGWGLMVCAAAIGTAAAIHVHLLVWPGQTTDPTR